MAKVEFQVWIKTHNGPEYWLVVAYGTKKFCIEKYAQYKEIPSIKEIQLVRKENGKKTIIA